MNPSPAGRYAIIGAQKARSTYLHMAVRQHPGVFAPPTELDHFEDPAWGRRTRPFDDYFAAARPGQVIGFKRPELMGRPECPARLAATWPDARLLAVLREPVDRTVSAYFHYVRSGWLPLKPLNEGLRDILDGRATDPHAAEVVDFGLYGTHLDRYAEHFDRSQVLALLDSDLDDDYSISMGRVIDHLGLPERDLPRPARGTNEGVYSLARLRWLRLGTRAMYIRDAETGKIRVVRFRRLGRAANRLVFETDRLLGAPFAKSAVPQLDDDVRARLQERFEPDIRRLEQIIDRRLPGWPGRAPDPAAAS